MKKYILFENKGIIELMALFVMGASTKRDDNSKIGRFGSGLKYAMAKLLRDGVEVRIFAGEQEIGVCLKPFELKGKPFNMIIVDGKETYNTTDMGPDWQMWQALREIWCNALDEGDADMRVVEDDALIYGKPEKTRVYIAINNEIQDVLSNWNQYFAADRDDILVDTPNFKVYRANNGKHILYRRGIRIAASDKPALFHYDYSGFEINEERVLTSEWTANYMIGNELGKFATEEVADAIMRNAIRQEMYEQNIDWSYATLSDNWKEAARRFDHIILHGVSGYYSGLMAKTNNYAIVGNALAKGLFNIGIHVAGLNEEGRAKEWTEVGQLTRKQEFLLNEVVDVLGKHLGYDMRYPITIVEFTDPHRLGKADLKNNTILLSQKLFDRGRREIALCLMEEQEHIYEHLADESRALQNHLFSKWLGALEEKAGYFF